jgi:type VI protein secretion system component VasK
VTTIGVWLLVAAVVVVLFLAWSLWTLTRLRRLSGRVDRAWTQLESQLQRRAGLADELAREHPDALGPGTAQRLAAAAAAARTPPSGDREPAEHALGR